MLNQVTILAASGLSGRIAEWVTSVMTSLGEPGAGLLIALENLFPPLPSELILPLAGFTAGQGGMNLLGAIIWTTIGSLSGAIALYYVGAILGRERTRAIAKKLPLVKVSDIDKTEAWFLKHETKTVFFGRMIPLFRSLISIPAGIEAMKMTTFILYTTLGSLIWNSVFIFAGYLLGDNWQVVGTYVGLMQNVVIGVLVLALGWFVFTRISRRKRRS